jgi:hypothetical protein
LTTLDPSASTTAKDIVTSIIIVLSPINADHLFDPRKMVVNSMLTTSSKSKPNALSNFVRDNHHHRFTSI